MLFRENIENCQPSTINITLVMSEILKSAHAACFILHVPPFMNLFLISLWTHGYSINKWKPCVFQSRVNKISHNGSYVKYLYYCKSVLQFLLNDKTVLTVFHVGLKAVCNKSIFEEESWPSQILPRSLCRPYKMWACYSSWGASPGELSHPSAF